MIRLGSSRAQKANAADMVVSQVGRAGSPSAHSSASSHLSYPHQGVTAGREVLADRRVAGWGGDGRGAGVHLAPIALLPPFLPRLAFEAEEDIGVGVGHDRTIQGDDGCMLVNAPDVDQVLRQ
jgi:hypothetical protein